MDESVRYLSGDGNTEGDFLKSLTFAFAMSFHSILEGFALGVQNDKTGIRNLFLSLIIHKGIEAFSVGLQVSRSNTRRIGLVITTILVYALMTPVGSMLGVLLTVSGFKIIFCLKNNYVLSQFLEKIIFKN
jgi:zinc transporter 1/2/3